MMFNALAPGFNGTPQTFGITPQPQGARGYFNNSTSAALLASQPNMVAMMEQFAQVLQAVSLLGGGFAEFAGAEQAKK